MRLGLIEVFLRRKKRDICTINVALFSFLPAVHHTDIILRPMDFTQDDVLLHLCIYGASLNRRMRFSLDFVDPSSCTM